MGQSSSTSTVTNQTSTFTSTIADAFNNALNTTQNFSNIGGVTLAQPSGGGNAFFIVALAGVALVAFLVLFKKKG